MTNEIKEILEEWKQFLTWCYKNNDKTVEIHRDKLKFIIDYITNLQEENEKLRMRNDMLREDIDSFIQDNKIDYKTRVDRAIKYINNFEYYIPEDNIPGLLEILKGE